MFSIVVKNHIMIAHSLPDPFFGPAQNMHGATYAVEAHILSKTLNDKNVVIDIGYASEVLSKVLSKLAYKNLDAIDEFNGVLTTTEFIAKYIHDKMKENLDTHLRLKIVLHETPDASSTYEEL